MTTLKLPAPPVPARLREMLRDYPEHIERLQEVLNKVVENPSAATPPFEVAIWMLEGALEEFIDQARTEHQATEASGDAAAIAWAKQKLDLMLDARSSNSGMRNLSDLRSYFKANREVFE